MNKHIELVKKWLANPKSVTKEELKDNAYAAAYAADAADAAAYVADATAAASAAYATYDDAADAAAYAANWVKRYEELTNER
jgi:hypothetical protein|tara:strand:- start:2450 stop:2695 length:246 start_codon:yes stop_codon:yes gene_type:complete